ncbi:c2H2-type domain-containing protein [Trichonephila inaurata madagascariensis]|uniref:C2H2-type domain-containing protein n=1 Tax=Trichonephila inaurata madagascariensis TaxID=2747483 RepID=A0A8X6Y8V7_9ARAC|nr:c2H2-type domain-containing protein [Trichonephila inaurata madagascariensis]
MKVIAKKSTVAKKIETDSENEPIECNFCGKTYEFNKFISHSQCYQFTCTLCSAGFDFEHHLNQHSMEKHGDVSVKSNSFVAFNKTSKISSVQNQNTRDYNLRFKPVSVYGDTNKDLAESKNQHFEQTELHSSADKSTKKKLFLKPNSQMRFSKSNSQKRLKIDHNSLEQNHNNEVSNISYKNQFSNGIKASVRNQTVEITEKETRNTLKNKSISDHSCSRTTFEKLPCNSKRKKTVNTWKNTIPDDFCSKTTNELGCSSQKKEIRNTLKNSIPGGFCSKTTSMELECSSTKKETRSFQKYSIPDTKESRCSLIKKRTRNTLKNSIPGNFSSNTTVKELPCSSMQRETRNILKNSVPGVFGSTNTVEELPCNSRQRETRNTLKNSIPGNFSSNTTIKELPCSSMQRETKNILKNSVPGVFGSTNTVEELPCNTRQRETRNTLKNSIPGNFSSNTTVKELPCSSMQRETRNILMNSVPGVFGSTNTVEELPCNSRQRETRNTLKNSIPGNFSSNTTVKELPCSSMQRETRNILKNSVPGVFGSTNTVEELPCNSRQRETRNTLKISIPDDFCSKTTVEESPDNSTTKETKNNLNKNSNQEGFNSKTCNKESYYSTKSSTSDKTILNGLCKNNLIKRNRKCKIFAKQSISKPKNPCVPILKKDIKNSKLRAPIEKIKKANTQEGQRYSTKLNENYSLKKAKYDDLPPGNPLTDKVDIRLLLKSVQDEDTGILLQKQNNADANVKCSKCGKPFRTMKQASIHFSSCKSPKCKITSVPVNEVRWVCILCHKDYSHNIQLVQHKKFCKILMKKDYGNAYETCPKCKFKYISGISLLQHKCDENVKELNSCTVQLWKLPSFTGPLYNNCLKLYDCLHCDRCYIAKFLFLAHLKRRHDIPGSDVKPLCLNLDEHCIRLIIKNEGGIKDTESEDCMMDTEFENGMKDTECEDVMKVTESERYSSTFQTSNVQESSSSAVKDNVTTNPLDSIRRVLNSCSFSMPQIFRNSPPNQPSTNPSSAQMFNQSALHNTPGTANPATNVNLNWLCEKICNCPKVKTNSEGERKTCVKCMNKTVGISKLASMLCTISFNAYKIKREKNDQGTSGQNLFDLSTMFGTLTESTKKNLSLCGGNANRFVTLELFDAMRLASLTPPPSVHGSTPPTTPNTVIVQSPPNKATLPSKELGSSSEAAGGNVVPDITQLPDRQQSPSAPLTSVKEPNGVEAISGQASSPEEFCCNQEQSEIPLPPYNIICEWNMSNMNKLDAWAIVTSPDTKEAELFCCAHCVLNVFKDQDSLARHMFTDHSKQGDIFVSYMHKQDYHNNTQ